LHVFYWQNSLNLQCVIVAFTCTYVCFFCAETATKQEGGNDYSAWFKPITVTLLAMMNADHTGLRNNKRKFSTSARRLLLAVCLLLGVVASGWLMPRAGSGESPASAGQLSAKGQILSLEKISRLAKSYKPGEILEVELEKKHGRYVYEVEILDTRSQVWELKLDARTGQLLKMELDD
jgi:uncharacterized membrane protein YkoI